MAHGFARLLVAACAIISSSVFAQPESDASYKADLQIPYCVVDGRELHLNAFLPRDATAPAPAIVEIHGGWFYGGDAASNVNRLG